VKNIKTIVIAAVAAVLVAAAVIALFGVIREGRRERNISRGEEKLIKTFYGEYNSRNFEYIYHVMFGANYRQNAPYAEFEAVQKAIYSRTGKVLKWERKEREVKKDGDRTQLYSSYKTLREKHNTIDEFIIMEQNGIWTIENIRQGPEKLK
jgi:hypothetical protein